MHYISELKFLIPIVVRTNLNATRLRGHTNSKTTILWCTIQRGSIHNSGRARQLNGSHGPLKSVQQVGIGLSSFCSHQVSTDNGAVYDLSMNSRGIIRTCYRPTGLVLAVIFIYVVISVLDYTASNFNVATRTFGYNAKETYDQVRCSLPYTII